MNTVIQTGITAGILSGATALDIRPQYKTVL